MNEQDVYTILAAKHNQANSLRYRRILKLLMTPVQSQLVALLPATAEELSAKLNISLDRVKKEMDSLFIKGVVIPKDFNTKDGARFCRTTLQLHDATLADMRTDVNVSPELLDSWEDFCQHEWYPQLAKEYQERASLPDRVIPAYQSVKDIPGISPFDDAREILKAASPIAVVPCACRHQSRHTRTALQTCLQFGRSAEYAIVRGSGKQVSFDEAMKVLEKAEEDGQVHTWPNAQTLSYGVMCNCINDSCVFWTPIIQSGMSPLKRAAQSRFEIRINQELCTGCKVCVSRCQFNAIEMVKVAGTKKLKAVVHPDKCGGCGVCVIKCKPKALRMELVRPLEHIPKECQK